MASSSLTATYESLPKLAKVILQLVLGYVVGSVYRILRYFETKKSIVTLVAGILGFVGLGLVFWVIDLVTEITSNRITFLAE